jgi:hypothetical protein
MHSSSSSLGRAKYPSGEFNYKVVISLIEDYKTAQSDENVKIHTKLTGIYL